MAPKKPAGGGKKETEKVKKIVEDKTFGMKNKSKSQKIQKYVEEIKKQASDVNSKKKEVDACPTKKQLAAQKAAEMAEIFKPVATQQKIPFGTDPKTILCANFKAGVCTKGIKCKFSHDLEVGRKSGKIDVYTDIRETSKAGEAGGGPEGTCKNESMDDWDLNKLEAVISSKHGNPRTQTDIVCKFFLEAIELAKYGWFWICPNGGDKCKYRHALPPGYVLKQRKPGELGGAGALGSEHRGGDSSEGGPQISLEEFLDSERHKLGTDLTPVTLESFTAWKKRRLEAAATVVAEEMREKERAARSGKRAGLSGRELFIFNPDLIDMETGDDADGLRGFAGGAAPGGGGASEDISSYIRANQAADIENERAAALQAEFQQKQQYQRDQQDQQDQEQNTEQTDFGDTSAAGDVVTELANLQIEDDF